MVREPSGPDPDLLQAFRGTLEQITLLVTTARFLADRLEQMQPLSPEEFALLRQKLDTVDSQVQYLQALFNATPGWTIPPGGTPPH